MTEAGWVRPSLSTIILSNRRKQMAEKIYFFDDGSKMIADFFDNPEPDNIEASFAVEDGMSRLVNRYSLNKGKLVDDYPDDDDEAVCVKEQEAEAAAAKKLEDDLKGE